MHILLVDGEPRVRSALQLLLQQQQDIHAVWEADSTATMLAMLDQTIPNAVFIDWDIPEAGGYDAIRTLRKAHPDLVIIAISGRPEVNIAARKAGADAFVSKGDPPEHLLETLYDVVARH